VRTLLLSISARPSSRSLRDLPARFPASSEYLDTTPTPSMNELIVNHQEV
jgi:hypothetical protein